MAEGYAKLLSSILDSSIWVEPDDVLRVWVTLLAMADRDGYVGASVSGIARRTHTVSVERVAECLELFQCPDPDSRSPESDGRRIRKVERGWLLINYKKIRDMHGQDTHEAEKERKRKWWQEHRSKAAKSSSSSSELDTTSASESKLDTSYGSVVANGSVSSGSLDRAQEVPTSEPKPRRKSGLAKSKSSPVDPPDPFVPTEATLKRAADNNRDWAKDWEACRDHHLKKGNPICDWQAALRTWLTNANKFEQLNLLGGAATRNGRDPRAGNCPQPNAKTNRPVIPGL
jgi:hypothetical protein